MVECDEQFLLPGPGDGRERNDWSLGERGVRHEGAHVAYEVQYTQAGKEFELTLATDGSIVERELILFHL